MPNNDCSTGPVDPGAGYPGPQSPLTWPALLGGNAVRCHVVLSLTTRLAPPGRIRPLVVVAAALAVAAAACSGSDGQREVPGTYSSAAPPTFAPTGDEAVDAIVGAVLQGDSAALGALLHPTPVACSTVPGPTMPSLVCERGEAEGSLHNVVTTGGCQPTYVSPEGAVQILQQALRQSYRLYAVAIEGAGFRIVFANEGDAGAFVILVDAVGITSFGGACGHSAPEAVGTPSGFLVPPQF